MPDDLTDAFSDFFDATAAVSGTRREAGAAVPRVLRLTVACSVFDGSSVDPLSQSGAPGCELSWTIILRRADWLDHLPPQKGDTLSVDGYPTLTVARAIPFGADMWSLTCSSKEAMP